MEPEGSLPYSQQPSIYPYPKPEKSNPRFQTFHENPFQYHPSTYTAVFQVVSFPQVFQTELCMHVSSPTLRVTGQIQLRITCVSKKITNPDVAGAAVA